MTVKQGGWLWGCVKNGKGLTKKGKKNPIDRATQGIPEERAVGGRRRG